MPNTRWPIRVARVCSMRSEARASWKQAAKRSTKPMARSVAPSSRAPASDVIAPPVNEATTERPSTGAKTSCSGLHCVRIGELLWPLWPEPSRCSTTTLTQSEPRCTRVLGQHRYEVGDPVVSGEASEQGDADVDHALSLRDHDRAPPEPGQPMALAGVVPLDAMRLLLARVELSDRQEHVIDHVIVGAVQARAPALQPRDQALAGDFVTSKCSHLRTARLPATHGLA